MTSDEAMKLPRALTQAVVCLSALGPGPDKVGSFIAFEGKTPRGFPLKTPQSGKSKRSRWGELHVPPNTPPSPRGIRRFPIGGSWISSGTPNIPLFQRNEVPANGEGLPRTSGGRAGTVSESANFLWRTRTSEGRSIAKPASLGPASGPENSAPEGSPEESIPMPAAGLSPDRPPIKQSASPATKLWRAILPLLIALGLVASPVYAGEIRGTVRLDGLVPAAEEMVIPPKEGVHSTQGCGSTKSSPRLLVDPSGGVSNAVVWLEAPSGLSPPQNRRAGPKGTVPVVLLDQISCEFSPHVLVTPVGSRISIRNSDSILHNIRIFEGTKMLMHRWQKPSETDSWRFTEPGRYVIRCGVHPWMHAWIVAAEHRHYAVTDAGGHFILPDSPPGKQTLHVWHEALGMQTLPVVIEKKDRELDPIVFSRS